MNRIYVNCVHDSGRSTNDHYALLYDSRAERLDQVVDYLRDGLRANDRCLYVTHETPVEAIESALERRDVDAAARVESGDLTIASYDSLYLRDGTFHPGEALDLLETYVAESAADGYERLRVTGEMTWAIDRGVDRRKILEYERRADVRSPDAPIVGLCQYDRNRVPAEVLRGVLRTHPYVSQGSDTYENSYYRPPSAHPVTESDALDRELRQIKRYDRAMSSLRKREREMSTLDWLGRRLNGNEADDVVEYTVEAVTNALPASVATVWRYDEETGDLDPRSFVSEGLEATESDVEDRFRLAAWDAFATNETVRADPGTIDQGNGSDSSERGIVVPLDRHGSLLVLPAVPRTFTEAELECLRTIARHATAALDGTQYERIVEERNEELVEKNARIERLDWCRELLQNAIRAVVEPSERDDVETAVCTELVSTPTIRYAWIGSYAPGDGTVDVRTDAGYGEGYLDSVSLDGDSSEPAALAARTREPQVISRIRDEPPFEGWRKEALKSGFQSAISYPIVSRGSLYGVMTAYSETPAAFDDEVQAVFEGTSRLVAHAITSLEQRRALVSEQLIELELRLSDPTEPIVGLDGERARRFALDGVVPQQDGSFRVFFTLEDCPAENPETLVERMGMIESGRAISERTFTGTIPETSIVSTILDHGAIPRSITADEDGATLVVTIPAEKSVREFVQAFRTRYPSAELVARRRYEGDRPTRHELLGTLEESLSDRQREILEAAYRGGYFEWPRDQTGEDLAALFDVTQPTISRHLREVQRTVFSLLFEGDAP